MEILFIQLLEQHLSNLRKKINKLYINRRVQIRARRFFKLRISKKLIKTLFNFYSNLKASIGLSLAALRAG